MLSAVRAIAAQVAGHPIGSRDRLASYGRIVWWQLQSRLASGMVERNWFGGAKLVVRSGMHGATGNLYFGLFEFADMAFALHLLGPDDLFIDVGANVGVFTVLAAKICGARVIAFEPATETLLHLRANIAANEIGGRVVVHACALGEVAGEVGFTVGLDCINHVATEIDGERRMVPVRPLDEMLNDEAPVMIKIDVEGFERDVIAGAAETLARPSLLAIEIETVAAATHAMIVAAGFTECFYDPVERTLRTEPLPHPAGNRLFVRDRAAVLARLARAPRRNIHGVTV